MSFFTRFFVLTVYLSICSAELDKPWQKQDPIVIDPTTVRSNRVNKNKLYNSPECQQDILEYCPRAKQVELNDLAVLQCIHNEVKSLNMLSSECHHVCFCFDYVF